MTIKSRLWIVFVNDSLGELDWLAPFLKYAVLKNSVEKIIINYSLPHESNYSIDQIHNRYFGASERIVRHKHWLNRYSRILDRNFNIVRRFINRRLNKNKILRRLFDKTYSILIALLAVFMNFEKADIYFTDYNLQKSFSCRLYERVHPAEKPIIFPHSTALMINDTRLMRDPPKLLDCKILLENSYLSNYFTDVYKSKVKVVGSPSLEAFKRTGSKYSWNSGVLIITRPPDEINFGLLQLPMKIKFIEFVRAANKLSVPVYVKHHPRQADISMWSDPDIDYQLIDYTLNDFTKDLRAVFSFYSSAPVLFAANGIPCFDLGCVSMSSEHLPYHYRGKDGKVTHALIDYGIIHDAQDLEPYYAISQSNQALSELGKKGLLNVNRYFPTKSNENILNVLKTYE